MFGRDKKKAQLEMAEAQRARVISFKRVFGSPEGKEVLCEILDRCHVLDTRELTPFQQGQRSVGVRILTDMAMNLNNFETLMSTGEIA